MRGGRAIETTYTPQSILQRVEAATCGLATIHENTRSIPRIRAKKPDESNPQEKALRQTTKTPREPRGCSSSEPQSHTALPLRHPAPSCPRKKKKANIVIPVLPVSPLTEAFFFLSLSSERGGGSTGSGDVHPWFKSLHVHLGRGRSVCRRGRVTPTTYIDFFFLFTSALDLFVRRRMHGGRTFHPLPPLRWDPGSVGTAVLIQGSAPAPSAVAPRDRYRMLPCATGLRPHRLSSPLVTREPEPGRGEYRAVLPRGVLCLGKTGA